MGSRLNGGTKSRIEPVPHARPPDAVSLRRARVAELAERTLGALHDLFERRVAQLLARAPGALHHVPLVAAHVRRAGRAYRKVRSARARGPAPPPQLAG